ncbi:hypothetical protein PISMIDRAFT_679883 [Pisolithus microcarpus 441]|uniref:F-box domain-containing protein n=1 Tax=Pisolithus microcarpus 441 TaxID=765257 RepID=A0A0C9ZJN8_9AGAM|nr:hypothetical protein BKA83DRAFT_679883 [Pisolithus microcarpus]KIK22692.1 hypothetical protein PISMIDRAFT_679883 [Pisolithus microcarpus 441]
MPSSLKPVVQETLSPGGLPLELWLMVMKLLPNRSARSCLQVCRSWHDMALTVLFRTVKLHFLGPGLAFYDDCSTQQKVLSVPISERSWEILDYIATNSTFGKAIKYIVVYASVAPLAFEKLCLIKALRCMPHLLGFEWISENSPSIIQHIQQTLLVSCRNLRHLRYPLDTMPPPFDPFPQKLTSLNLTPAEMWENEDNAFWYIIDVFPSSLDTLTSLTLACVSMKDIPTQMFQMFARLRELALWEPYEIDALLLPLRHEKALESLSLRCADGGDNLRTFLRGATALLPRLTTFLLTSDEYIESDDLNAIRDFLIAHPGLMRLHLCIYCPSQLTPILYPALAKLQSLEALWLDTGPGETLDIRPLLAVLPRSLQVLVLYVHHDCFGELLRCLTEFSHLRSLCVPYELPLTPQVLAMELEHLTFVAAGKSVQYVERGFSDGKVELCRAPLLEVATWHPSDFDDPNMAWMAEDLKSWITSAEWKVLH